MLSTTQSIASGVTTSLTSESVTYKNTGPTTLTLYVKVVLVRTDLVDIPFKYTISVGTSSKTAYDYISS